MVVCFLSVVILKCKSCLIILSSQYKINIFSCWNTSSCQFYLWRPIMLLTFNDIIFINAFLRLTRLTITHSFCLSSSLCLPPSLPHNLAAVTARLWERAKTGPFPSASAAAAAAREAHHPAVEPGERNTEERTHREKGEREKGREKERARKDGRSGIVRSGPNRLHYRPDHLRQTAADHPEIAVLGESWFSRYWCVWWRGGGGGAGGDLCCCGAWLVTCSHHNNEPARNPVIVIK